LRTEDLEGAIWVPEDAVAKLPAVCKALAKLAKEGGVYSPTSFENVTLHKFGKSFSYFHYICSRCTLCGELSSTTGLD